MEITDDLIRELARSASLAPSCFNKQPWNFIFVRDPNQLHRLHETLPDGNEWARDGSLLVAVFSRKNLDCVIKKRVYYLFDTGLASAFLILRATEIGLVAYPIAGFDEERGKDVLEIPTQMRLIALIVVGKKTGGVNPALSDFQKQAELNRPQRKSFGEFAFIDRYLAD